MKEGQTEEMGLETGTLFGKLQTGACLEILEGLRKEQQKEESCQSEI